MERGCQPWLLEYTFFLRLLSIVADCVWDDERHYCSGEYLLDKTKLCIDGQESSVGYIIYFIPTSCRHPSLALQRQMYPRL